MGVAIRALPGVERDYNAHSVWMILRNIFDHSGNITQIAKPQRKTNQASQNQMSRSSRFIVGARFGELPTLVRVQRCGLG